MGVPLLPFRHLSPVLALLGLPSAAHAAGVSFLPLFVAGAGACVYIPAYVLLVLAGLVSGQPKTQEEARVQGNWALATANLLAIHCWLAMLGFMVRWAALSPTIGDDIPALFGLLAGLASRMLSDASAADLW